ncbi:Killing trait domain-containing protein [Tistlia consotensis]|uniref:Killing trait domain-containing protein n=1 Tax=Tistlia consotensis USBA 355 TaxID=560819 RepID=A0A1Y6BNK2_9PROT|nr:RebB family R body protein [Tistlia consotensis]SMF10014.1 Killing trait domain-containing protein [Tistlia consotensis USBA 355]SNR34076.1 Killing trait domain-containing protein [Tistlia consotensis]
MPSKREHIDERVERTETFEAEAVYAPERPYRQRGSHAMDSVNPQITDAVSQTNVKILGEAGAVAIAQNYLAASQANNILFANMVSNQMNGAMSSQAAAVEGALKLLRPGKGD